MDIILGSGAAATIDRSSPMRNRSRSAERMRHGAIPLDPTPISVVSRYINTEYKGVRPQTGGRKLKSAILNGSHQAIPKNNVTLEQALAEVQDQKIKRIQMENEKLLKEHDLFKKEIEKMENLIEVVTRPMDEN